MRLFPAGEAYQRSVFSFPRHAAGHDGNGDAARRGSAMKRALLIILAVGVLLLAVGAGVYVFRARAPANASRPQAVPAPRAPTPAGNPAATGAPHPTPRGDVTIDPRRQQL